MDQGPNRHASVVDGSEESVMAVHSHREVTLSISGNASEIFSPNLALLLSFR